MRRRSFTVAALAAGLLVVPTSSMGSPSVARTVGTSGHGSPNLQPVANLPHVGGAQPDAPGGGSDIEFATIAVAGAPRVFAFAGTLARGLQVIDVTDPGQPVRVAHYDCQVNQGDVQVFPRDDRWLLTYTSDYDPVLDSACFREAEAAGYPVGSGLGTFILDVTDPAHPQLVSFIEIPQGSHNQTVDPSGRYLYNSNSDLVAGELAAIEYHDISDPARPVKVGELPLVTGLESHDITFSADGRRAYAAALTHTLILDTSDPARPRIIGRIIDPTINIHHQADPVTIDDPLLGRRDFLIVTDEIAGAAGNGLCPGGGLHVFDITGPLEALPLKVGVWFIPEVRPALDNLRCTSHVLRFHPEHRLMTIAWYDAGVRVVDISSLAGFGAGGMREIGFYEFDGADTWSAKAPHINADGSFYLFGNDIARGLDVFRFDPQAPAAAAGGQWLSPTEYAARAPARPAADPRQLTPTYCQLTTV